MKCAKSLYLVTFSRDEMERARDKTPVLAPLVPLAPVIDCALYIKACKYF
jgi:hypothetical protein